MPSHFSSPWNNAVAFLTMHYGETLLSSGSCFFWEHDARIFLVTNWHNLAGRNHQTGDVLSETASLPDRVVFRAFKQLSEPTVDGFVEVDSVPISISLYDNNFVGSKWFEHPLFRRSVDVAAIDVTTVIQGFQVKPVNVLESDAHIDLRASQEVFVVGFPFGLIVKAPAPVWKRGSIALDPTYDPDSLPKMLVDSATREGMSGSVVIARHIVLNGEYPRKDGSLSPKVLYAELDVVAGIYSGRHYPDLEKAQLAIVWKRSVIEQTVSARVPATSHLL